MKKITSLLMLFLVCLGTAWAQLPDGVKASTESNPIRYNLGSAGQNKGYYADLYNKQFEQENVKHVFGE